MASNLLRLGNNCNQQCLFCTVANDGEKELSGKEARNAIKKIAAHGKTISFTGGEPTTRKDLAQLLAFAKSSGIETVELQTNALLLGKGQARRLRAAGLDSAFVSLHSHKKSVSERLVGRKGTFLKTTFGIRNLIAAGVATTISHVVTTANCNDLREFVRFVEASFPGVRCVYFGLARPNGRCGANRFLVPTLRGIEPQLESVFEYCREKKIRFEIEGVPLCYTAGFEEHNAESRRMLEGAVVYIGAGGDMQDIHRKGLAFTKAKGAQCTLCNLGRLCPGVWKEYAEIHGTLELFPQYTDAKAIEAKIRGLAE